MSLGHSLYFPQEKMSFLQGLVKFSVFVTGQNQTSNLVLYR